MGDALGKDVAVFGEMSTQGVDALSTLTHQKIPGPEHDAVCLLLLVLDRDEAHARPLRRLADRLGICGIVLLPFHERFDVGGRDQTHCVTQRAELTGPVVRPGARLHRDNAGRLCCEEPEQLRPRETLAETAYGRPASAPWAWKTRFAMSSPIVVTCPTDASFR